MSKITQVGRVLVAVGDQDEAIDFYTNLLGFSLVADIPFGEDSRWVEVGPPGGGTSFALVPPQDEFRPGRTTGIALESTDPKADHDELQSKGVDVDAQLWGGDGTVPLGFFFRDNNNNQLMIVEAR
jgi:lactoylglutathione lyase